MKLFKRSLCTMWMLWVMCGWMTACGGVDWETVKQEEKKLKTFVGKPDCAAITDCKFVQLGRSCGGKFLVYSAKSVDENKLQTMVGEYNKLEESASSGFSSGACMLVPTKSTKFQCAKQRCEAVCEGDCKGVLYGDINP